MYHFLHGGLEAFCEVGIGRETKGGLKSGVGHYSFSREKIRLIFGFVGEFSRYLLLIIKICNENGQQKFSFLRAYSK